MISRYEPSPNDSKVFAVPTPTWRPPALGSTPMAAATDAVVSASDGVASTRWSIAATVSSICAPLICTNARRMLASASCNVAASGPRRDAEPVDEAADGVDRQRGVGQPRRRGAEVDRGQLVQAHRVVGDDDLGGHLGESPAGLVQRVEGIVDLRVELVVRRFVGHPRYPSCDNSA